MYRIIFIVILVSVSLSISKDQVHRMEKKKMLDGHKLGGNKLGGHNNNNLSNKAMLPEGDNAMLPEDDNAMLPEDENADDKDKKEKEIDYDTIKSPGGSWVPAFVHRNNWEYEKYGNGTMIEKKEFFESLVKTTKRLHDIIVFQEQCLSDLEFEHLRNLSAHMKDRIIVVKSADLLNPVDVIQNITIGVDFNNKSNITYRNVRVLFPYVTLKRNELQINSNKTRAYMENHIDGFVEKYETTYEAFMPLIDHYTWIRFHVHTWPSNLTMEARKMHQRKHFKIFEKFIKTHRRKVGKQFLIYTSDSTFCHAGQLKKPTEIWTMEDKRWGATTIWCRAHHVLLQIADLTVMYPNEILVKPKGARYCETTVYRRHMVVAMRIDQYSPDVDLYFDIKLPSRRDAYRTYTVERCYLQGRKSEGHEFNRKVKLGNTFFNRHNRLVLKKACPRNGALVLGTIGLEYLPRDTDNVVKEKFSNITARRIVFLVEGGLQDYCRVKKVFDWMAFAKRICVMMILIALPFAIFLLLSLLIIRLRFYFYRCIMCIKAVALELWIRSKPTAVKMKEMAMSSPQTLSNTMQNVKSSDVTYGCYKCLMLLHPKNIASCGKASGQGMKRLCTPVGHLIGIGAYLLQRFVYNMCVKIGGAPRGAGQSLSARFGRAREYTAQHIGNVAIYFIQGLVTISVVRAVTLVAATLLEIS